MGRHFGDFFGPETVESETVLETLSAISRRFEVLQRNTEFCLNARRLSGLRQRNKHHE
jgi:hypothetical protein